MGTIFASFQSPEKCRAARICWITWSRTVRSGQRFSLAGAREFHRIQLLCLHQAVWEMSKPFPPGSPAHLMWGVRAWKVLTKCEPLRGQWRRHKVRVKQLGDLLRCWCSRALPIVISRAHRLREGLRFIIELRKGPKAYGLPREISRISRLSRIRVLAFARNSR